MTKSWLCTLIGRLIYDGVFPEGLDTIVDIPEWHGKPEFKMTIRDMLQMSDGLDFDVSRLCQTIKINISISPNVKHFGASDFCLG